MIIIYIVIEKYFQSLYTQFFVEEFPTHKNDSWSERKYRKLEDLCISSGAQILPRQRKREREIDMSRERKRKRE